MEKSRNFKIRFFLFFLRSRLGLSTIRYSTKFQEKKICQPQNFQLWNFKFGQNLVKKVKVFFWKFNFFQKILKTPSQLLFRGTIFISNIFQYNLPKKLLLVNQPPEKLKSKFGWNSYVRTEPNSVGSYLITTLYFMKNFRLVALTIW